MKSARNRARKKAREQCVLARTCVRSCYSCTGSGDYPTKEGVEIHGTIKTIETDENEGGKPLLFRRSSSSRGRHDERNRDEEKEVASAADAIEREAAGAAGAIERKEEKGEGW